MEIEDTKSDPLSNFTLYPKFYPLSKIMQVFLLHNFLTYNSIFLF